jgi:hypothetical protein
MDHRPTDDDDKDKIMAVTRNLWFHIVSYCAN